MSPQDFISAISEAAKLSGASDPSRRIPASFTAAEAALESGWGKSRLSTDGKNLFGVKADKAWRGDVLSINTLEFINGEPKNVPANWRRYQSWQECIDDHAAFLRDNPRYSECFKSQNGEEFARAVAAAGYATDPNYAEKIISVIHAHNLLELDK
jgi:flagellar rod assembly protein/muramidase FlgJ